MDHNDRQATPPDARPAILVISQDPALASAVEQALGDRCTLQTVATIDDALRAARASLPALLIGDVDDAQGAQTLDPAQLQRVWRAEEQFSAIPLLLLAAESPQVGADEHLLKPFSPRELRSCVEAQLKLARLRGEMAQALRQSEARYRAIVEGQSEMVSRFRPDGTLLFVNGAYARARGATPEELTGANFWDWIEEEDRPGVRAMLERITPESPEIRIENRFETADGVRWTLWANRGLVFDENGRAVELQSAGIDITDRKRAEEALRQSEQRFRLMADAAPVLIWISDADGRCTWVNEKWLQFVGRAMEHELGDGWTESVHSGDRHSALKIYQTAFAARKPFSIEYRLRRHDGEYRWVLDNGIPLYTTTGEFRGYIGSCIDIHDRKEAEEVLRLAAARDRFRAALADALRPVPDPVQIQRVATRVLGEYLGADRVMYGEIEEDAEHVVVAHDYCAGDVSSVVGRYRLANFGAGIVDQLRAGRTIVIQDVRREPALPAAVRAAYEALDVGAGVAVPLVKGGRFVAVFGVHQARPRLWTPDEIALIEETAERTWAAVERARADEALRQLNETLEERVEQRTRQVRRLLSRLTMAEQEERRYVSQILHDDLQQLLYGIEMKMAMIEQDLREYGHPQHLHELAEARAWINQAITTTRQLTVDLSPPILQNEGLADALEWLQRQMQELHGLHVTLEAEHSFVLPDEDLRVLLFHMVRELLFNVKKHAGVDRATVFLREENEDIVIEVVDEGRGYDVRLLNSQSQQASGFGLYNIRERLKLLGGQFHMRSQPGKGTRARARLPLPRQVSST